MLCGAGLSADILSCVTEAENCMSLLLSDDMFNVAMNQTGDADDRDIADTLHVADSHGCEETDERCEMNEELSIVVDHDGQSQCEHSDVDCGQKVSADSISDGRSVDVLNESVTLSTADVDSGHYTQPNVDDEVNTHRHHGVHSFRYALHVDIASHIRVERTEDNADVVRTLQELTTLLVNRYVPTVKCWLEVNVYHRCLFRSESFGSRGIK